MIKEPLSEPLASSLRVTAIYRDFSRSAKVGVRFGVRCGHPPRKPSLLLQLGMEPVAGLEPAAGKMACLRFSHRKTGGAKTGASSSAATANAVSEKSSPMFDRKKGPFFGLFCRKTGVRAQQNDTFFCVFPVFWEFFLFNPLRLNDKRPSGPSKINRA